VLGVIRHVVEVITLAGRGVVTPAAMAMMLLSLLLVLLRMMMMVMMMVVMIQRGGGRRGRGQSEPARTRGCTAGASAERRRRLHRLHLRLHQGGEDGLETGHLHAAATIVRRHRLIGDVGSRRRHRHRHLLACLRRCHITAFGGDRDDRCAIVRATIGPLPVRSQARPLLGDDTVLRRRRQFLQEARQHHKPTRSVSPESDDAFRGACSVSYRLLSSRRRSAERVVH